MSNLRFCLNNVEMSNCIAGHGMEEHIYSSHAHVIRENSVGARDNLQTCLPMVF